MKNLIVLFSSILFVACLSQSQSYADLSPKEFKSAFEKEAAILLDVRTPQEVASGTIENASVIDYYDSEFSNKISMIQKDKTVYVYCKSGGRSSKAAQLLVQSGQAKVVNLKGGIMAWQAADLPLSRSTLETDESIQQLSIADFDGVLSSNSLVLADFHTLWCAPCRKMSPIVDELKVEFENRVEVLRIDMDKSEVLADSYHIKAVPTFILFKDGQEVWRHTGLIGKEEIETLILSNL